MRYVEKIIVFVFLLYSICLSGQIKDSSQYNNSDYKELLREANKNLKERNIQSAIVFATKADSVYRAQHGHPYSRANSVLGLCYKDLGDLIKAHQYYQKAINEESDKVVKTYMLLNMVDLGVEAGDTIMAIHFFEENIDTIQARFLPKEKAYCYLVIGNLMQGCQYSSSKVTIPYLYNISYEASVKSNSYEGAGFAALNLSQYYNKVNEDSVIYWLNKAYIMQNIANSPLGMADVLLGMAEYYSNRNQLDSALHYYTKAMPFSMKANYVPFVESNYKGLAETYEKLHEYELSNKYLRNYYSYKDSIENEHWRSDLSEMQMKYGVKERNKRITQLTNILKGIKWKVVLLFFVFWLISVAIYFLLRHRHKRNILARVEERKPIEKAKPRKLSDEKVNLWLQLQELMSQQKVFLDPDLTLMSLSQQLKTNRSTLSEVINEKSGKSFNQYINQFRIEVSTQLLQNKAKDHLSIEGIALEVGFKSRSSFYTAFVNSYGDTPSNYRKRFADKVEAIS